MLIRIPETPGIPAVLREIAALCPRHSSTAEQHGYSLFSPLAREASASRPTRACEDTRARDIYRGHTQDEGEALRGWSRLRSYTHFPSCRICLPLRPPVPHMLLSSFRGEKVDWPWLEIYRLPCAGVQGAFPWRNAAMIFLENGYVEDLIKSKKNYCEFW